MAGLGGGVAFFILKIQSEKFIMKPTLRKLFFCAFIFSSWSLFGQEVDTIFHQCPIRGASERETIYVDAPLGGDCQDLEGNVSFADNSRERIGALTMLYTISN